METAVTSDRRGLYGAILLSLAVAACAAHEYAAAPAPRTVPAEGRDQPKARISSLDDHLGQSLGQLGLERPSNAEVMDAIQRGGTPEPRACPAPPPPTQACSDICTLAGSICDDAKRICDLAAQLAGDDWAAEKCESGRLSCEKASERCCNCT